MSSVALRALAVAACVAAAACVPADQALELGSVSFTVTASRGVESGISAPHARTGQWTIRFDRVLLALRTMTIGKIGDPDRCSYRGSGEQNDVVFDARIGIVQTFNGVQPTECPDVGVFLAPPGDATDVGPGATGDDLVELATGSPAHAIVEATATERDRSVRVRLRFDTATTASRFGGCTAGRRGIRIVANAREEVSVRFAAETLFRDAISTTSRFRFEPFVLADADGDDVVTMAELDALPLRTVRTLLGQGGQFYQLPDGSTRGSFGDFVRALFRFTFTFRDAGLCFGNEPGAE